MPLTSNFTARTFYPVTSSDNPGKNRDIHGELVKFFDSMPNWQRIASQSGSAGTGLGTTGDADSSGEEAWAVWRAVSASHPYDVAIKWSWNNFYATGQFTCGSSNWGVGFSIAFHSSSQAWNGTAENDLADTFDNDNPWKSGSLMFPRQNEQGGAFATEGTRDYVAPLCVTLNTNGGMTCVGDDDWFFVHISQSAATTNWIYFGPYLPLTTSYQQPRTFPYVLLSCQNGEGFDFGQTFGGTSAVDTLNGAVTFISTGSAIAGGLPRNGIFSLATISSSVSSETKVSFSGSGTTPINELPILIYSSENGYVPSALGYLEHLRAVNSDLSLYDYLSQANRLVLSGNTNLEGYAQLTIPYSSSITGSLPEGQVRNLNTTFLTSSLFTTPTVDGGLTPVFRGESLIDGSFVYQEGSPPTGQVENIIIIGFK